MISVYKIKMKRKKKIINIKIIRIKKMNMKLKKIKNKIYN